MGTLMVAAWIMLSACKTPTPGYSNDDTYNGPMIKEPVDSAVVDARREKILAYITDLSNGNATDYKGTVSGQNCYHGNQIAEFGFDDMIEGLHSKTGEWVGMIGIDYEYDKIFTSAELSEANEYLIHYAAAGGLITVNFSPQNPWKNDESDIKKNPGTSTGTSSPQNAASIRAVTSLNDLIDENKEVYTAWMRKMDRIAGALAQLRDAGVIVLFRPMQEMNGSWMWWGMKSHPNDPGPYINVYRHMHDYFTRVKSLNNLLWVYSPNSTFGIADVLQNTSSWNRNVTWAYPGDDYVDIVAGTEYDSAVNIHDYDRYLTLGKPIGMGEMGPTTKDGNIRTMDNTAIINRIASEYPRIAYWVSWHWDWAIVRNKKPQDLMSDPRVINRGDFNLF